VLLLIIQAAVLGLVQGLSEFLPISSSGHLVIAQNLFGLSEPEVFFDLILHLGTLSAVVYFYRIEVLGMIAELRQLASPKRLAVSYKTRPLFRLGVLVVIGSIPTALIGLLFEDYLTSLFSDVLAVGINLFITASLLFFTAFCKNTTVRSELEFPALLAVYIGIAQGIAIAPGLSRSGVTIALAILLGCDRILAARYSFLLSIPAILGGLILKIPTASQSDFPLDAMAVGFVMACIVGYFALKLLSFLLAKDRFHIFTPWCILAGLTAMYLYYFPVY
jgi:undecaprenyl-diphosphatase